MGRSEAFVGGDGPFGTRGSDFPFLPMSSPTASSASSATATWARFALARGAARPAMNETTGHELCLAKNGSQGRRPMTGNGVHRIAPGRAEVNGFVEEQSEELGYRSNRRVPTRYMSPLASVAILSSQERISPSGSRWHSRSGVIRSTAFVLSHFLTLSRRRLRLRAGNSSQGIGGT